MKLTDKALFRRVSESPGHNESEPIGGLDKEKFRRPSPLKPGEGSRGRRRLTDEALPFGGVVGIAR